MRDRPAPNAARTASSDSRAAVRPSDRLATLTQAMSRTNPTAPSRTSSGRRTLPTSSSWRRATRAVTPLLCLESSCASRAAIVFISPRAAASVAGGASRPIT